MTYASVFETRALPPAPVDLVDEVVDAVVIDDEPAPLPARVESTAIAKMGLDVTVDAFALRQALTRLKPAFKRGSRCLPVLSCVKVIATGGQVILLGTDLELTLETWLPQDDGLVGEGVLPFASTLAEIAKTTAKTSYPVRITVEDESTLATVDRGRITSVLHTQSIDEYPRMQRPAETGTPILLDYFPEIVRAAGVDDARPILTGVHITPTSIAATDSYRLHVIDDLTIDLPDDRPILIPARALDVLGKIGGPAVMVVEQRDVSFWTKDLRVTSVLIEGEFPNWRGLLPDNPPSRVWFDVDEMRFAVLETVRLLGNSVSPTVLAVDDGQLTVSRQEQDFKKVAIEVRGGMDDRSDTIRFGLNGRYFADVLDDMEVHELLITDALKPALMREPHPLGGVRKRLLMPVRIS